MAAQRCGIKGLSFFLLFIYVCKVTETGCCKIASVEDGDEELYGMVMEEPSPPPKESSGESEPTGEGGHPSEPLFTPFNDSKHSKHPGGQFLPIFLRLDPTYMTVILPQEHWSFISPTMLCTSSPHLPLVLLSWTQRRPNRSHSFSLVLLFPSVSNHLASIFYCQNFRMIGLQAKISFLSCSLVLQMFTISL